MEVYNVEKVQCSLCKRTWLTNILSQMCLYPPCKEMVYYELDRVKDAA